jgi:hypothetical protein
MMQSSSSPECTVYVVDDDDSARDQVRPENRALGAR